MAALAQNFGIRFDTSALAGMVDVVSRMNPAALVELRDSTVNLVSLNVRETSAADTYKYLNLSRDYIDAQMSRTRSPRGAGKAFVKAMVRGTTLQRFGEGIQQQVKPVNWSNARIREAGHEFGEWPGWTERTGDRYGIRNIQANDKADGVSVKVYRNKGAVHFKHGFSVGLNSGNGFGVFGHPKTGGKIKHTYGPSVYQTFRHYIRTNGEDIADELRDTFLAGLDKQIGAT